MNKNIYILPVSTTFRDISYPEELIRTKEILESRLKSNGVAVSIKTQLAPGLYKGVIDGKSCIVKHFENKVPQTPIEFFVMADRYTTEAKVLKRLQSTDEVRVPQILNLSPKLNTIIMEDVSKEGYTSFADQLLKKKCNMKSASQIATSLATLAVTSRGWDEITTNESAQLNYYDRSLEMLIAYPNNLDRYRSLSQSYSPYEDNDAVEKKKRYFVWPDCTPENILITKDGASTFVDFERAYWGDQQIMISVFVAHIILYSLIGCISQDDSTMYLKDFIKTYKSIDPDYTEKTIVEYIAMELLHRSNGKGIKGITSSDQSLAVQRFARTLLDHETTTISSMMSLLKKS